jgi:hypothetical protein
MIHAARKALEDLEEDEEDDDLVQEKILNMNEDDGKCLLSEFRIRHLTPRRRGRVGRGFCVS